MIFVFEHLIKYYSVENVEVNIVQEQQSFNICFHANMMIFFSIK